MANIIITVGELIALLERFPNGAIVTDEYNEPVVHVRPTNGRVILSTQMPVGTCNRTGADVYPTTVDGYEAYSPELDEDLYGFEFTPIPHGGDD